MKKLYLLTIILLLSNWVNAQNGGEITYRSLSSTSYEVTTILYRDCRGGPIGSINLSVSASGVTTEVITPTRTAIEEIKYECNSASAKCNPANTSSTGYGLERHIFVDTIDFGASPFNSAGWTSACEITVAYSTCCRVNASNLTNPGNFYLNATFNKCKAAINQSPVFTNQPLFRVAAVQSHKYSYGMIDSTDRDSLSIRFIAPKTSVSGTVTYGTSGLCGKPYMATMPLTAFQLNPCGPYKQTTTEGFYLDHYTGELYFTPNVLKEDGPIAVEVTEWRKNTSGVYEVVGTIMRENFIIVEEVKDNNTPQLTGPFVYQVNAGDVLSFDIKSNDNPVIPPPPNPPNAPDTLVMTWDSGISNAGFSIVDPTARTKTGRFSWTPTCDDAIDGHHRFTVTVRDNNCNGEIRQSRTVLVKVNRIKTIDLGPDITICDGDTTTLSIKNGFTGSYLWTGNVTSSTMQVNTAGDYVLRGINYCNDTAYDTVHVYVSPKPIVELGPDSNVCNGVTYALEVNAPNAKSIQWSTNSSGDSIHVGVSGKYWVTVDDMYCGIFTDTVTITRRDKPTVNLGPDSIHCGSFNQTLDAGSNPFPQTYSWHPGNQMSQTIIADSVGLYWVEVTNACGSARDSIILTDTTTLNFTLGPDMLICDQPSVQLSTSILNAQYQWSTNANDTNSMITIDSTGLYWIEITLCSVTKRDSIYLTFESSPTVNLGTDTTFTGSVSDTLNAGNLGSTYLWSTGDTTQSIIIDSAGTYWVDVTNDCGTVRDSITIVLIGIKIPDLAKNITVYPNPSNGIFSISFEGIKVTDMNVVITSLEGKQLLQRDIATIQGSNHTETFDISHLPAGVYYLTLNTNKGSHTMRVLLNQ